MLLPCMCKQQICSQMPHICSISTLVYVQIGDNCISIYVSHELTAMKSVTKSTAICTFHIIVIYPRTNMLLHCTHIPDCISTITCITMLLSSTYQSKTKNTTLIYHAVAIYIPEINMPLKCYTYTTYPNYSMCINR